MIQEDMTLGELVRRLSDRGLYEVNMKQLRGGWQAKYMLHGECYETVFCTTYGQMVDEMLDGRRIHLVRA